MVALRRTWGGYEWDANRKTEETVNIFNGEWAHRNADDKRDLFRVEKGSSACS